MADFTASIDVIPLSDRGMAGLIFRHSNHAFYYLIIGPGDQTYQLMLFDNQAYTTLIPSTFSAAIAAYPATTRLKVTAIGDQIALYANNEPLALIEHAAPRSGQLGLFVFNPSTSSSTNTIALFNFDNMLVLTPRAIDEAAFAAAATCQAQAARNVNVRSGPGENYSVLGSLSPGTPLPVTARNGQWVAVTLNGHEGWVAGWIVSLNGACDTLAYQEPTAPVLAQQAPAPQPAQAAQPAVQPVDPQNPAPAQPEQPAQPPADQPPQQCSLTIVNGSGSRLTDIRMGKGAEWIGVAGALDAGGSISLTVDCGLYYDCSGLLNGTTWWWDASGNIPANGTCNISRPS